MNKLLIISGPTASGKTSLALLLAKKFNGELISADSRQVYRGMDIVTGKDLPAKNSKLKTQNSKIQVKTQKFRTLEPRIAGQTPVWMVDVVSPDESFTVSDYYEQAWGVIADIWQREKLPIVVGGTGFYIKAVLDGIGTMGIAPDWQLRRQLEILTVEALQKRLREVDLKRWEKMNESDRKNPRRLIRAIEVALSEKQKYFNTVQYFSSRHGPLENEERDKVNDYLSTAPYLSKEEDILWTGLQAEFALLYQRIDQRVDERLKLGAVEETKQLAKKYGWEIPSMTGQGYRELRGYIDGKISLEEAVKGWKFAEHEYARKQMTWFKKEKRIVWFEITKKDFLESMQRKVGEWYTT